MDHKIRGLCKIGQNYSEQPALSSFSVSGSRPIRPVRPVIPKGKQVLSAIFKNWDNCAVVSTGYCKWSCLRPAQIAVQWLDSSLLRWSANVSVCDCFANTKRWIWMLRTSCIPVSLSQIDSIWYFRPFLVSITISPVFCDLLRLLPYLLHDKANTHGKTFPVSAGGYLILIGVENLRNSASLSTGAWCMARPLISDSGLRSLAYCSLCLRMTDIGHIIITILCHYLKKL